MKEGKLYGDLESMARMPKSKSGMQKLLRLPQGLIMGEYPRETN